MEPELNDYSILGYGSSKDATLAHLEGARKELSDRLRENGAPEALPALGQIVTGIYSSQRTVAPKNPEDVSPALVTAQQFFDHGTTFVGNSFEEVEKMAHEVLGEGIVDYAAQYKIEQIVLLNPAQLRTAEPYSRGL